MYKLHDYQTELVNLARDELAGGSKGVLIQSPPGSGKSVVIAEIVKKATEKGGHVLFLVHRKELTEQIKESLIKHEVDVSRVSILTVIKARNRLRDMPNPAIIVTDETHHSRAKTYTDIYEYFPQSVRLGFTATPWRMNGKGFTDIYDSAVYGQQVQALISDEKLADYDYYSINITDEKSLKKSSTGDYTKQSIDDAIDKAIYGDVVKHYTEIANGRKTILYAHSVEASKEIAEEFNAAGITAVHADAKTPKRERNRIMQDFRSGHIKILCNVDLISEGFDVPDCNCVIQMRPTASLVLYIQQAMRSMRHQPGKRAVIIDHVGNYVKHGLPRQDRDWASHFKGESKKKRKNDIDDSLPIKECLTCFAVIEGNHSICPHCGSGFEVKENELEKKEATLTKIDETFKTDYTLVDYATKDLSELKSVEDYYLFAIATNKKINWIKFQHPDLKQMNWPDFHQTLKPIKQKYNY